MKLIEDAKATISALANLLSGPSDHPTAEAEYKKLFGLVGSAFEHVKMGLLAGHPSSVEASKEIAKTVEKTNPSPA